MPKLTEEQILQARGVELLDYLQTYEPGSVRRSGANEYCLVEHDSFKMSNGKFYWWSQGFGGHSALDFLIKVRGIGFVDAVQSLTGGDIMPLYSSKQEPPRISPPPKMSKSSVPQIPSKPLILPKPNQNNDRVIAYLRSRGISKTVINHCIQLGLLYESTAHRCVFVGKDENGKARFACERGTDDDWKKDVANSDKRFSFTLPSESANNGNLAVFESPADVLAHFSIHEAGQTGWDGCRLSLGGVSQIALNSFLERNPGVMHIQLCLDSDKAGHDATVRIIGGLLNNKRFSDMKITVVPAAIGKDYADTAKAIQQLNSERATTINRPFEAVF
jgi:hypothetical protein